MVQSFISRATLSRYLSTLRRLLNALPATRLTATALDAFLQVTGHRLYGAYGRQFVKLLHCVDNDFLSDLRKVCGSRIGLHVRQPDLRGSEVMHTSTGWHRLDRCSSGAAAVAQTWSQ